MKTVTEISYAPTEFEVGEANIFGVSRFLLSYCMNSNDHESCEANKYREKKPFEVGCNPIEFFGRK